MKAKTLFLTGTALLAFTTVMTSYSQARADEGVENFLPLNGFYVDARYRYEHVEQDSFTKDADASTLRTKVGYKTNTLNGFQGLIEFEAVGHTGANDDHNNTVNGKTTYPVIADPDGVELNQLWVSYSGLPDTTIKIGRQGINLDNQRFIGTVGWRQNDQTFDSVIVSNNSIENLNLLYSHVSNVNRIFGNEHPLGDLDTETHIARASYKAADWLTVTGYGYWLDFDRAATSSSKTYGVRLTGDAPINQDWTFFYEAEGAEQDDHGNNTASYDATYYHLAPGVKWNNWTFQAGFESLEGDGTSSFQTPLATGHKFNGWADKFLTTPGGGLEDAYGKVTYKFDGINPWLNSTKLTAVYHDFDAENGSADYGDEWNLQLTRPLKLDNIGWSEGASVSLKYADYDADSFSTDTQKWWVVFQVRF